MRFTVSAEEGGGARTGITDCAMPVRVLYGHSPTAASSAGGAAGAGGEEAPRLAPLERVYWSVALRRVLTAEETALEIDFFVNPEDCTTSDREQAAMFGNRCLNSFQCPGCRSAVSVTRRGDEHVFFCGFCCWDSLQLAEPLRDAKPDRLILRMLDLEKQTPQARAIGPLVDRFQRQLGGDSAPTSERLRGKGGGRGGSAGPWTLSDLQESMSEGAAAEAPAPAATEGGAAAAAQADEAAYAQRASAAGDTITSLRQRMTQPALQPADANRLLPQRRNMLARCSRRCLYSAGAEARGRLVVKPEADSEFAFDLHSVAFAFVPRIYVVRLPDVSAASQESRIIQLSFTNPLEEACEVQVEPSLAASVAATCLIEEAATFNLGASRAQQAQALPCDGKQVLSRPSANKAVVQFRLSEPSGAAFCFGLRLTVSPESEEPFEYLSTITLSAT